MSIAKHRFVEFDSNTDDMLAKSVSVVVNQLFGLVSLNRNTGKYDLQRSNSQV